MTWLRYTTGTSTANGATRPFEPRRSRMERQHANTRGERHRADQHAEPERILARARERDRLERLQDEADGDEHPARAERQQILAAREHDAEAEKERRLQEAGFTTPDVVAGIENRTVRTGDQRQPVEDGGHHQQLTQSPASQHHRAEEDGERQRDKEPQVDARAVQQEPDGIGKQAARVPGQRRQPG